MTFSNGPGANCNQMTINVFRMPTPFFSIIVPTCNRPEELQACLKQLAPDKQLFPSEHREVIVTDDGSDTQSQSLIRSHFPWANHSFGPRKGPAANRNHGAAMARGKWLVFIDDDCLPGLEWLAAYNRAAIQTTETLTVLDGPTLQEKTPPSLLYEAPHNPAGIYKISANFAIRKVDFEIVGRFDPRFPLAAFEDTEFFDRFERLGGVHRFVFDAAVIHPLRPLGSSLRLARRWEGKVIQAFDQGAPCHTILWRLPWHVFRVIQSRFRSQSWNRDNVRALVTFMGELIYVVLLTPTWIKKWGSREPSPFWQQQRIQSGHLPKYGF